MHIRKRLLRLDRAPRRAGVIVVLICCVVVAADEVDLAELEQNEEDAVDRAPESDGARVQAFVVGKASGNESN